MRDLPEEEWADIQRKIPIACVDVLPIRWDSLDGAPRLHVGLIRRYYPDARASNPREVWCVVGGRQYIEETIPEAIVGQLARTLGVRPMGTPPTDPIRVVEYLLVPRREGDPYDPRRHAIGPLYPVELAAGVPKRPPHGSEALEFRWFEDGTFPAQFEIGFGLRATLEACVEQLKQRGPLRGSAVSGT
jgi:ADP-ribose pyrophosphatase YjhB (NUDIX family)